MKDALPNTASVKKNLAEAKDQVADATNVIKDAVKDALPSAKGHSGSLSGKIVDPMFREEAGETSLPPPIPQEKYKQ